jgi:hypothetical protein
MSYFPFVVVALVSAAFGLAYVLNNKEALKTKYGIK